MLLLVLFHDTVHHMKGCFADKNVLMNQILGKDGHSSHWQVHVVPQHGAQHGEGGVVVPSVQVRSLHLVTQPVHQLIVEGHILITLAGLGGKGGHNSLFRGGVRAC